MIYVTMTDKSLSGWGMAHGKINKLIFECETYEEACKVEQVALQRPEMKYINICARLPSYSATRYYMQVKTKVDCPYWYGVKP